MEEYIIETERLGLRRIILSDAIPFAPINADPDVMEHITGGTLTYEETKERVRHWITLYDIDGFGLFTIVLKSTKEVIGFCGLLPQEVDDKLYIELGYRFGKPHWGKGYATEAGLAIRDYAIKTFPIIHELISIIQPKNTASIRVAEKMGMHKFKDTTYGPDKVILYRYVRPGLI